MEACAWGTTLSPMGFENSRPQTVVLSTGGSGRVSEGKRPHFAAMMPALWAVSGSIMRSTGTKLSANENWTSELHRL